MNLPFTSKNLSRATKGFSLLALTVVFATSGCNKEKQLSTNPGEEKSTIAQTVPAVQNMPLSKVMTVANVRQMADGTNQVMFCENAQVFAVVDEAILVKLSNCLATNTKVKVTFDPWKGQVVAINDPSSAELKASIKPTFSSPGSAKKVDLKTMSDDKLDEMGRIGVLNYTGPGLTNVVPDMTTAQLMFNYISKQCCAIPGPYAIDYCISFQYADDGCYARAHKMCDILNNKYHYDTHKIFSFANAGSDILSVQAQKWGGCCVNWWYHVAPLVNIKTPTGVKAFVFDPAMFDQPVLLSVWLHAQENPVCAWGIPNVSMINIQPTAMYAPSDYSGYAFMTDPGYSDTNSTLIAYSSLLTCP